MTWLKETTHRDESYWMARVQQLIANNTTSTSDGHGETNEKWLLQLFDEVVVGLPPAGPVPYDGNMRLAATISAILGLWYSQVHHAKSQDSHRPTFVRQAAYFARLQWVYSFFANVLDVSGGATYFPGQPWQNPFAGDSKGGDFL